MFFSILFILTSVQFSGCAKHGQKTSNENNLVDNGTTMPQGNSISNQLPQEAKKEHLLTAFDYRTNEGLPRTGVETYGGKPVTMEHTEYSLFICEPNRENNSGQLCFSSKRYKIVEWKRDNIKEFLANHTTPVKVVVTDVKHPTFRSPSILAESTFTFRPLSGQIIPKYSDCRSIVLDVDIYGWMGFSELKAGDERTILFTDEGKMVY